MDLEFAVAYQELVEDPQPVNLSLTKLDGWLLLTPIQLASKHPQAKNSSIIKKAIKVAKVFEALVVGNSKALKEITRCSWLGIEPKVASQEFIQEFEPLSSQEIKLQLTKEEIWCVLAASQLAARHSGYKNTNAAIQSKDILDQLTAAIPEGVLLTVLNAGWDTRFDQPLNRKGFG